MALCAGSPLSPPVNPIFSEEMFLCVLPTHVLREGHIYYVLHLEDSPRSCPPISNPEGAFKESLGSTLGTVPCMDKIVGYRATILNVQVVKLAYTSFIVIMFFTSSSIFDLVPSWFWPLVKESQSTSKDFRIPHQRPFTKPQLTQHGSPVDSIELGNLESLTSHEISLTCPFRKLKDYILGSSQIAKVMKVATFLPTMASFILSLSFTVNWHPFRPYPAPLDIAASTFRMCSTHCLHQDLLQHLSQEERLDNRGVHRDTISNRFSLGWDLNTGKRNILFLSWGSTICEL